MTEAATLGDLKAVAERPPEVRLSVVREPLSGKVREFVRYEGGHEVEVPRRKLTDFLEAEVRFGRPLSEIKGFSSTGTFTAYLALYRHEDPAERPTEEYEKWVEGVEDYEMAVAVPPEATEGDDADPLAQDKPGDGQKPASAVREA